MKKQWKVLEKISDSECGQFPEIHPLALQLLMNRGIKTQDKIDEFLYPDYGKDVHDPFLLSGMEKAVERIMKAIVNKEMIMAYGDYDADGVCATAVLVSVLKGLGVDPHVHIPYRESEGYGLNMKVVDEIREKNISLIITVDCGIANVKEIEAIQKSGADVIVTDHHIPQEILPGAYSLINPKLTSDYPSQDICGTAVAFKLAQALVSEKNRAEYKDRVNFPVAGFEKWLLDLVAIGTVSDLVELTGESRTLTKYGLMVLKKTRRAGLIELMKISRIDVNTLNTFSIGFQIGPRLNAAGRMGHALTSYELLMTNNSTEATGLANDLHIKNQMRQKLGESMRTSAVKQIVGRENDFMVFAKDDTWSPPLVGLVAGRVCEELFRPCIIIGKNTEGKIVGSGRSIDGFDITRALGECKEYLLRYGGHTHACGFTLKDDSVYDEFKKMMLSLAEKSLKEKDLAPELAIDSRAILSEISWEFMKELEKFEPYGHGNHEPRFLIEKCKVAACNTVGQNGSHLKGAITDDKNTLRQIIGFGLGALCKTIKAGDSVDIVCEPSINQWNGNREIQLKIIDMKLSSN